jgi:hypothetical protein
MQITEEEKARLHVQYVLILLDHYWAGYFLTTPLRKSKIYLINNLDSLRL